eukprot:4780434-Amphidinium_carterae.2
MPSRRRSHRVSMLRTQNVAALQFCGRWASAATMQHYDIGAAVGRVGAHHPVAAMRHATSSERNLTPDYVGTMQCRFIVEGSHSGRRNLGEASFVTSSLLRIVPAI